MSPLWRRGLVLLATLVGVAVTVSMGRWQLGRAEQKLALQRVLDERAALPALPGASLARTDVEAAGQVHRLIRVEGVWRPERTVFLDNRQMHGQPGFFVVTPLELASCEPLQGRAVPSPPPEGDQKTWGGPAFSCEAVLVQRGWAPRDPRDRTRVPVAPLPAGRVVVEGRVAPPPSKLFEFAGAASGPIRQNLDLGDFARETGLRLRPVSLLQQVPPVPDDGLLRDWPRPAVDVAKHHGYAFQWFAMAAVMAGLYVWFQLLRPFLARRHAR